MIKPFDHQLELGKQAYEILRDYGLAYLSGEERTGKTVASLVCAEMCLNIDTVLVITKKKAYADWQEVLKNFDKRHKYILTTFHQVHKVSTNFDICIIDEAHNYISSWPKPGAIWKSTREKVYGKPILYLSATPHAQGYQMLYHQFALSAWSPWHKYPNFYKWFKVYGKSYTIKIQGLDRVQYDKCHEDRIREESEHLFVTKTRKELNFAQEPVDKLHYIELDEETKEVYNELVEHELCELRVGMLVCDTESKMRTSLHQLEGGTIKIDGKGHILKNTEKIDHILNTFGDDPNLVIMYNFTTELEKLQQYFSKARLLQATSYSEGISLHEYDHLVIYSQDYSAARHTQRRARQCNIERTKPIIVHYLLVKKAISSEVYKTVSINKKNYVDSLYQRNKI